MGEEEEHGETDRPATQVLATPFLGRVLPAGTLRGKPKPVGTKASGLVEVRESSSCFLDKTLLSVLSS